MIEQPTPSPREVLAMIRARYDHGAVPQGVYEVIKSLEQHEAWLQHARRARRIDEMARQVGAA